MKKLVIILLVVLITCAIFSFSFTKLLATEKPLYQNINVDDIKERIDNKQSFVLFFYQKTCLGCKEIKPIINTYIHKTGNQIYAIDINDIDDKSYLIQNLNISGTPTVIFYKNGIEKDRIINIFNMELLEAKINEYAIYEVRKNEE
ncbi:thioredoxin family protein [Lacrimispora sp. 38-1]|uniref:thioredoxin family protein n=1 Tax=Lacrimispora sp. 38-1 TaxID=3125778 RepID=UPI003CF190D3